MIKPGGWMTGGDYRYYREHGHGVMSAWLMTISTVRLWFICGMLGVIGGLISCFLIL